VYLFIKKLRIKRLSKKLDYIKDGLFLIKEARGPINYILDLLVDTKVYLVFYLFTRASRL